MSCPDAEKLISARLDRELSTIETAELDAHLAGCEACRRAAGEYAALVDELESAFRAEPLATPAPRARPRPRIPWLRLAAAVLLVAGGILGAYLSRTKAPVSPPTVERGPRVVQLDSGTRVVVKGPARGVEFAGAGDDADEVIHLEEGEIEIFAAKAAPGRRAVRVITRLGEVETLGTIFSVKLVNSGNGEGGKDMKLKKLAPLTAVVMLVAVSQGRVLIRGALGEAVVHAGEVAEVGGDKLAVSKTARTIKGKVTEVGDKGATVSVGKADGLKKGFELTCKAKGWSGKVISLAENSAVLEVTGKAAVGDVVQTKLTTVLAEAPKVDPKTKPDPAAADPVKAGPKVNGLQLTLIEKEIVRTYERTVYTTKEGKVIRMWGQDGIRTKIPEDAKKEVQKREHKYKQLTATLKNVGEEPILLPAGYGYSSYLRGIKVCATDAEGKAVPRKKFRGGKRHGGGEKKDQPLCVTILKPGQTLERRLYAYYLQFPAEGKYKLWAELEVKDSEEVLPGQKIWSGKLKSNEIEHEHKARARYGRKKTAPAEKPGKKEVF